VVLLAAYAAFVLYFAVRYRRRWPAFVAVGLGVSALMLTARLLSVNEVVFGMRARQFAMLLWFETAAVGTLGLYVACLPRGRGVMDCAQCGYDLSGLEPRELRCPECGEKWLGAGSGSASGASVVTLTPILNGTAASGEGKSRSLAERDSPMVHVKRPS
jgi:hypothetical protein